MYSDCVPAIRSQVQKESFAWKPRKSEIDMRFVLGGLSIFAFAMTALPMASSALPSMGRPAPAQQSLVEEARIVCRNVRVCKSADNAHKCSWVRRCYKVK
jgi:hypothetical protein